MLQANAPLPQDLYADDVGRSGLFLSSDLARCVTGVTLYVTPPSIESRLCYREQSTILDQGFGHVNLTSAFSLCIHRYVDNGLHAMGMALDSIAMQQK